eukprot:COSAG03_NODE_3286_length_2100_cov_3.301849_2_plen_67_part_00
MDPADPERTLAEVAAGELSLAAVLCTFPYSIISVYTTETERHREKERDTERETANFKLLSVYSCPQ